LWGELEPEEGKSIFITGIITNTKRTSEEEEESEEESEEEEEEATEAAPVDGLQTPSGLETPSGMASVVSTVAGGLETPDFLELRKSSARHTSDAPESGPRSLYQVVPEKQASVRGLMGSERGYDISQVTSAQNLPVLGEERGSKVRRNSTHDSNEADSHFSARQTGWTFPSMPESWRACLKMSYGASMINIREDPQGLGGRKKTFRIWWRKRWQRRDKRWNASGRLRRGRNSGFNDDLAPPTYYYYYTGSSLQHVSRGDDIHLMMINNLGTPHRFVRLGCAFPRLS